VDKERPVEACKESKERTYRKRRSSQGLKIQSVLQVVEYAPASWRFSGKRSGALDGPAIPRRGGGMLDPQQTEKASKEVVDDMGQGEAVSGKIGEAQG